MPVCAVQNGRAVLTRLEFGAECWPAAAIRHFSEGILVIAALVQFVEMFLKKNMKSLYESLGVYLPLITTNCAVLGIALSNVQNEYTILESIVNGFGSAVGFAISITILAGIREKLEYSDIPEAFKGTPIVLITSGLMAIAFFGFAGLI